MFNGKALDFTEKEQTSFPPYWQADEGKSFVGILVEKDMSDPKFIRYSFQALSPVPCKRGPANGTGPNSEDVEVQAGELFHISSWAGLAKLLDEYLDVPFPVPVQVLAKMKGKTAENQDFWHFDVRITPDTKKLLTKYRETKRLAKAAERPELEA
jgi:hypothetical protein